MDELHNLIEKKKYEGFLSERDALVFWRHVKARIDGSSGRWTQRDFAQLTRWQLGLAHYDAIPNCGRAGGRTLTKARRGFPGAAHATAQKVRHVRGTASGAKGKRSGAASKS